MLFLVLVFVGVIIFLAFYINSLLDRREERRLKAELERRRDPS